MISNLLNQSQNSNQWNSKKTHYLQSIQIWEATLVPRPCCLSKIIISWCHFLYKILYQNLKLNINIKASCFYHNDVFVRYCTVRYRTVILLKHYLSFFAIVLNICVRKYITMFVTVHTQNLSELIYRIVHSFHIFYYLVRY